MAKKSLAMKIENVSMKFNLSSEKVDNIKEYVIKMIKKELMFQEFWALRDISFEVQKGDRVGIMGLNGARKSTLLKVISGVLKATQGTVTTNGKIAPLLELGAGFDRQYTGAENIYLYGAMLGYSKEFLEARYDEIVEFSELGSFIDVPVKNYSSGMRARLGFSVATIVEPDILILDEPTAGLDPKGRDEILAAIHKLHEERGITVILVSHSMEDVARLVDRIIVMHKGKVAMTGTPREIFSHPMELEQMGLAAPQVSYVFAKLKEKGYDVPTDIYTVEEARDALLKLVKQVKA